MTFDHVAREPLDEQLAMATVADSRRVAFRHTHLAATASALILQNGFDRTSVRQIAAAAGWSMGQLYRYISTKDDVIFLVGTHVMDTVWGGLYVSEPGRNQRESLRNAAETLFNVVAPIADEVSVVYREAFAMKPEHRKIMVSAETAGRNYLAAIIRKGIASGEFVPSTNADLIAHDIIMLVHMWALKSWAWRSTISVEEFRDAQIRLILAGLTCEPEDG